MHSSNGRCDECHSKRGVWSTANGRCSANATRAATATRGVPNTAERERGECNTYSIGVGIILNGYSLVVFLL